MFSRLARYILLNDGVFILPILWYVGTSFHFINTHATCSMVLHIFYALFPDQLLPYCYSTNASVAAYAMGAMTNITIATSGVGGALDSSAEVVEVGSMVTESLMVMDINEMSSSTKHTDKPFQVGRVSYRIFHWGGGGGGREYAAWGGYPPFPTPTPPPPV